MASEVTFRYYSKAQGDAYATGRPGYSEALFKMIVDYHTSTGGQLNTVVDVGCGTGQATQDLSHYFTNTIGLDPSDGMISAARTSAGYANSAIRFEVSAAEVLGVDLESPIAAESVDLITAATAAHWFDMTRFWRSAARVLKPGGTAALWARTGMTVDPIRTPNGMAIKTLVGDVFGSELRPYDRLGNTLTRDLYIDLPLPWTLEVPVEEFDKESFFRKEWNKDKQDMDDDGMGTTRLVTPEEFENLLGTGSPVTRWREAHLDKVGTENDIVRRVRRQIERLLHEAGVKPGEEILTGQMAIVLLMIKKKTQ
ncbi:CYFA0S19e02366g1_1 [Cyberlindnera fabianii]|uniref:CYFA0S19e02366g1_1 n=1 Tax=Cyberlindnera fabianii TaxID=36022 RepID=A0A061BFH4_CYBFA|nr:CYFA0S19e02366g1_1 [Cyberlindnera fabianii]